MDKAKDMEGKTTQIMSESQGVYTEITKGRQILTSRVPVEKHAMKRDSLMAEQFRKIISNLNMVREERGLGSVLITSCMPGEGKTTVSINLAVSLSKREENPVILIDADLRRKSLSTMLGLKEWKGLSDVLIGRLSVEEVLLSTEFSNLKVLPAGSDSEAPAELIASLQMKRLFARLKQKNVNSFLIFDSTPLAITSEPNVLSEMVDGVISVILAERSRRDIVKREVETIKSEKILGVVLNRAEFETSSYYGRYNKEYSSRGKAENEWGTMFRRISQSRKKYRGA